MPLEPGSKLGQYEVLSRLGAGGMGEVYRAMDPKLEREVAIKLLREEVAQDPERLARFEREARVLASLNHPKIGGIHGLEELDGQKALILELVEGPTLADRIARGPVPVGEAVAIALQVAEALEAAHGQGVIHRDLKPTNIKVRTDGTVKVLDFGLAKAMRPDPEPGIVGISQAPTLTAELSAEGVVLGTAAYMAPEQARGQIVDKRADIWAFGCVLFETLTGQRPFRGESTTETLAAVLKTEVDVERSLPHEVPAEVVRLLRRCLQKNPERRIHDIADARLELEDLGNASGAGEATARAARPSPNRLAVLWATAATILATTATVLWIRNPAARPSPFHLQLNLPDGLHLAVDTAHPTLAVSPDGSRIAFIASDGGGRRLYLRDLDSKEVRAVAGTEGASSPFFSLDGEWVAYLSGYDLNKVSSTSGAPIAAHVTTPVTVHRGATWIVDEQVVQATSANTGLARFSVAGEARRPISDQMILTDPTAHSSWPSSLPDGRTVLFTSSNPEDRLAILEIDNRSTSTLAVTGTSPRYSKTGHLLYGRGGSLFAVPFDPEAHRVLGDEFRVIDGVLSDGNGSVQYAVGGDGVLAYVAGSHDAAGYELAWVDREGNAETLLDSPRPIFGPRLSPDGTQVAVTIVDGSNLDVWIVDAASGGLTRRITSHPGEDFGAIWHPDGRRMAFSSEIGESEHNGGPSFAWIEGPGAETEPLTATPGFGNWEFPSSWSPDGAVIAYVATQDGPEGDIYLLSPDEPEQPREFLATSADERAPMFSPDGRRMLYVSNDTGRYEVYVAALGAPEDRTPISSGGGTDPVWSRNGREIFYRQGDRLMRVDVNGDGDAFSPGTPSLLFELRFGRWDGYGASTANYDVGQDGSRVILARRKNRATGSVIDVVLNWPETLSGGDPGG